MAPPAQENFRHGGAKGRTRREAQGWAEQSKELYHESTPVTMKENWFTLADWM